jgi:orotate phosphoribosyltransferase-like protein
MKKFHIERFNLKKLNDVEVKKQYQVKISNTFAAVKNLVDDTEGIGRTCKNIIENMINFQPQAV